MAEFSIIVPWRTDKGFRQTVWDWNKERWTTLFPEAEIIEGDSGHVIFSRGASRNRAAERASEDLLVIVDADTAINSSAVEIALSNVKDHGGWVIPYGSDRYYNLTAETTAELLRHDPAEPLEEPRVWEHKLTSWCGVLVMARHAFDQAGRYDERFIGWGYEDNAFRAAMDVRHPHTREDSFAVHLWHPESERFDQPYIDHNRRLFAQYKTSPRFAQ